MRERKTEERTPRLSEPCNSPENKHAIPQEGSGKGTVAQRKNYDPIKKLPLSCRVTGEGQTDRRQRKKILLRPFWLSGF